MPSPRRSLLALTLLTAVVASAGPPAPPAEDRKQNRQELAALARKEPEEYARLRREAADFLALPEYRREGLVRLDQELHRQPPARQTRLLDALHRYADWLEALPEADRQAIRAAADGPERLRRIREVRERQWQQCLPKAVREQLAMLTGKPRADRVAELHKAERQDGRDWKVALRLWDVRPRKGRGGGRPLPTRPGDLDPAEQNYVRTYLRAALSGQESDSLQKAEGKWPRFARLLVELADRYPPALDRPRGPTRLSELPSDVQRRLVKQGLKKDGKAEFKRAWAAVRARLARAEGKWPAFALETVRLARERKFSLGPDFWPSGPGDLSLPVKDFLEKRLGPVLDEAEKARLKAAEAAWPAYPRTVQELAQRHDLTVPWRTLPGPRSRWDDYRLTEPAGEGRAAKRGRRKTAAAPGR
jgi:hypothetical protein